MFSLQALFGRSAGSAIGLDLSSSSVKLVELSRDSSGGWTLERCAIEPLERGWVADGVVQKFDEVAEAVRRVVKRSGTGMKNVVMALPPSAVVSKKIVLPADLTDQEMEIQVEVEAHQFVPFPLDEVCLDWCVAGPNGADVEEVEVLVAASKRETVQDRQGLAEAAGLNAVVMDVESYAARLATGRLIDRLERKGGDPLVALFEIGSATTNMHVLRNDQLLYERSHTIGGTQLTQRIAKHYGFSIAEAEYKKSRDDLPGDCYVAVIQPFVGMLAQEVGRALQYFFTTTPHHRVDFVALAGGSSVLPGLTDAITQLTSFPCRLVDPFEGMHMGSALRDKRVKREAPAYLTCCGLAMRGHLS